MGILRLPNKLLRVILVTGLPPVILVSSLGAEPPPPSASDLPIGPPLEADTSDSTAQALNPAGTAAPNPVSLPAPEVGRCPENMVDVVGQYCPGLLHTCRSYIDERMDRCGEFEPRSRCLGEERVREFCIDRYEYPNQVGVKPALTVTWLEATELCRERGKRLCTAEEWTLACEGPGRLPYPYGYIRDSDACNIDRPYRFPNDAAYASLATRLLEVERLDQREPSGSRLACVSSYGVFDMTGNVDEWVNNQSGSRQKAPYTSALKGGYWGPVRNRCRPITSSHNEWHSGYQIGFRCCTDALRPSSEVAGEGSTGQ